LNLAYNIARRNLGRQQQSPQSPGVQGRNQQDKIQAQKETAQIFSNTRRNVPNQNNEKIFEQELKKNLFQKKKKGFLG